MTHQELKQALVRAAMFRDALQRRRRNDPSVQARLQEYALRSCSALHIARALIQEMGESEITGLHLEAVLEMGLVALREIGQPELLELLASLGDTPPTVADALEPIEWVPTVRPDPRPDEEN